MDVVGLTMSILFGLPGLVYLAHLVRGTKWHRACKIALYVVLPTAAIVGFSLASAPDLKILIVNKAVVQGVVYGQSNSILGGVSLTLADSPPPLKRSHDVDWSGGIGEFSLEAPKPGSYYIIASKKNYQLWAENVTLTRGVVRDFNIHLSPEENVSHEPVTKIEVIEMEVASPELRGQLEEAVVTLFGSSTSKIPTVVAVLTLKNQSRDVLVWKTGDSWLLAETVDGRQIKLPVDYYSTLFVDSPFQGSKILLPAGKELSGHVVFSLPAGESQSDLVRIIGPALAFELEPSGLAAYLPSWLNPPKESMLEPTWALPAGP